MEIRCPQCSSKAFKKNGFTRHGKQNHRCLDCGRQFSTEPEVHFVFEVAQQHQQLPHQPHQPQQQPQKQEEMVAKAFPHE